MSHVWVCLVLFLCVQVYCGPPVDSDDEDGLSVSSSSHKPSHVIGTELTLSPAWYLHVGDRVSISCTMRSNARKKGYKVHLKIIWTPIGPGDRSQKVLVEQQNTTGVFYELGPVTHDHQGVYTCHTVPQPDTFTHDWHDIIWVADSSPIGSLDIVSHDRSQFFNNEAVSLACQVPGDHSQWKMMRFDDWTGEIQECPESSWSSETGLSCTVTMGHPWSDILYWCESATGLRTNPVNVTEIVVTVALVSPVLPVMEGDNVTLSCIHRNRTTKIIDTGFQAFYYKNGKLMRQSDKLSANVNFRSVTKDDEGLYKCNHLAWGSSHDSYLTVIARPDGQQKKADDVLKTTDA